MERDRLKMLAMGVVLGLAAGFLAGRAVYVDSAAASSGPALMGPAAPGAEAASAPAAPAGGGQRPMSPAEMTPQQRAEMEAQQKALHDEINTLMTRMKNDPKDREARVRMGNITFDNGMFDMAVKYYSEALALDGNDPNVLTDLGVAQHNLQSDKEAVANFQRAVELKPDHLNGWYNMALVKLTALSDRDGARKAVDRALEIDPTFAPAKDLKARIEAGT